MQRISTRKSSRTSAPAMFETLESRQLMSVSFGTNVIQNPGGEANAGASNSSTVVRPLNWTFNSNAGIVKYGTPNYPTSTTPGPTNRGANFFVGGNNQDSDLFQSVDISNIAPYVDKGGVSFNLSAWLGGHLTDNDQASVFLNFQNSGKGFISQVSVGPVTAANRGNVTKFLQRSLTGNIPANTRFIQVQIHFDYQTGVYNDSYADNLSLVLTNNLSTITGNVFNDLDGSKAQNGAEKGIGGVTVYLDFNNNGQFDSFELKTTTDSNGKFTFIVPFGTYTVRQIIPANFHMTTTQPGTFTVAKGATKSLTFGDKHN